MVGTRLGRGANLVVAQVHKFWGWNSLAGEDAGNGWKGFEDFVEAKGRHKACPYGSVDQVCVRAGTRPAPTGSVD